MKEAKGTTITEYAIIGGMVAFLGIAIIVGLQIGFMVLIAQWLRM